MTAAQDGAQWGHGAKSRGGFDTWGELRHHGLVPLEPGDVRVFISYSHEVQSHNLTVQAMAAELIELGFSVFLDERQEVPPSSWSELIERELPRADVVLCVCTPTYAERVDGEVPGGQGRGVAFEGALWRAEAYDQKMRSDRFWMVHLAGSALELPRLAGGSGTHLFRWSTDRDSLVRTLCEPTTRRRMVDALRHAFGDQVDELTTWASRFVSLGRDSVLDFDDRAFRVTGKLLTYQHPKVTKKALQELVTQWRELGDSLETVARALRLGRLRRNSAHLQPFTDSPEQNLGRELTKPTNATLAIDRPPRIFISYSHHESEEHTTAVLALAKALRHHGFDAWIDRFTVDPDEGWAAWITAELDKADFVLVAISASYLSSWRRRTPRGIGRGVAWEAHHIRNHIYSANGIAENIRPILLDGIGEESIPRELGTVSRFVLPEDLGELVRYLHRIPDTQPVPVGATSQPQVSEKWNGLDPPKLNPVRDAANWYHRLFWSDATVHSRVERLITALFQDDDGALVTLVSSMTGQRPPTERGFTAHDAMAALSATEVAPEDLLLKLRYLRPASCGYVDEVMLPALLWLACIEDGRDFDIQDLYTKTQPELLEYGRELAVDAPEESSLRAWWKRMHYGAIPRTTLPPVLWLKLKRSEDGKDGVYQVTRAELRRIGMRSLPLPLARTNVKSAPELARALTKLGLAASREAGPSYAGVNQFVVVIEANVEAFSFAVHSEDAEQSEDRLDEWFKAIAWWPSIGGEEKEEIAILGAEHDGPIPAPNSAGPCCVWVSEPPRDRRVRKRAQLGVWAAHGVWQASKSCPAAGKHNQRYFAVLADADSPLSEILSVAHPSDADGTLETLFDSVRTRARLIWTDRRFFHYK